MASSSSFHWADYLLFGVTILLSCSIGIYYGIQDRRKNKNTIEEFLMAGRQMSVLPVSVSLFVSWLSAISFIGDPVEVYYYGITYWAMGVGYCVALPLAGFFFAGKFHKMQLHSAFEFLEKRYNFTTRVMASVVQGGSGGVYCGFVLYGPSICLAQVTGISVWISVVAVGVICIFYTTLGGMKAVLWADTIQAGIMFMGLVLVVVRGCMAVGGIGQVWETAQATGRLDINFNPSPFVHSSIWTYFMGGFMSVFCCYVSIQPFIQRYGTLKTAQNARRAVYLNIPVYAIFVIMFGLFGLMMVAYFEGCDPLTAGRIEIKDQIVPLIVVELLSFIPGLSGIFLASVFCASLSSLSSYLNSLSLTLLEDIVEPAYTKTKQKDMSPGLSLALSKVFCVILGSMFIGLGLVLTTLKDATIFQMTRSLLGCFEGPMASLFVVGLFVKFATTKGCIVGCVLSVAINIWWYVGSVFVGGPPDSAMSVYGDNCTSLTNSTTGLEMTFTPTYSSSVSPDFVTTGTRTLESGFSVIYKLSPLLYNSLGFCISTSTMVLFGLISKCLRRKKSTHENGLGEKVALDSTITQL